MPKHQVIAILDIEDKTGEATDLNTLSDTATWLEVKLMGSNIAVEATVYPSVEGLVADKVDAATPPVHVLIQEGGSSTELYVHAHDTLEAAEADRVSCARDGAYLTSDIVQVPASLANHPDFFDVVEKLVRAVNTLSYHEA